MNEFFNWMDEHEALTTKELGFPSPYPKKDGTYYFRNKETGRLRFIITIKNDKMIKWMDIPDDFWRKK